LAIHRAVCALLAVAACGAISAQADLIIVPTFDSSITSDPNAAAIEGAIDDAIDVFESTYSTNITVPIYFQEGGGLGESNFFYYTTSYADYYAALVATDANPAAIAGLTANGGAGVDNPVTGTSDIDIKSANARAVGIDIPPGCIPTGSAGSMTCTYDSGGTNPNDVDGIISLNTSITNPPQPNNGSTYALIPVAEHEIDEILGLGSSLPNTNASSGTVTGIAGNPAPEDLFRYNASGARVFTVNCASPGSAYFSYSGATDLTQFNNACNGADFGDWATGVQAQVQDAYASPGDDPAYGPNEIAAESAIGYTLATTTPEPATWMLLSCGLGIVAFRFRGRVTAPPPSGPES
jgi:hypothetical protein